MSKLLANQIANFGDDAPIEIKEGLNIPAGKPLQAAGVTGNSGQVLTSTGTTIQWVTPFDGDYNSLTGRPTIPAAQVQVDWNSSSGLTSILNKPIVPAQPSIVTNAAGTAALAYDSGNGQFTYTPPDLSGFAANTNVANWDAAYGWGNHASEGYLVATNADKTNWNTAYGWGNHASAGYLTSYTETSTFQNVIDRGNTSTSPVYVTNKLYFSNAFGTLTDLQAVNATTYHGMFAHAHDTGHGYFAHAGGWTQLLDEVSSIDELGDVDTTTNAPSDGYVLKWEASSGSWKPAPDLVGTSNAGITLVDLSVNNATASATPSLSYSNTTGVFTYTPYDPSTYTETDPVFTSSPVANVQATDIANWDQAHGWGNHASAGYLTSLGTALLDSDFMSNGLMKRTAAGTYAIVADESSNWSTAYGWGNHASAGYLTAEADTLQTVTARGATTNQSLRVNNSGGNQVFNIDSSTGRLTVGSTSLSIAAGITMYHGNTLSTPTLTMNAQGGTISCGQLTAGGLTYPTTNGNNGQVLTSDGAGNVTWSTVSSGGGGANVSISDTAPGGASAGDLWWESDTGRLKIRYQDTDSTQWVDTNPPLSPSLSSNAPASASATGTAGDIRYDSNYVYICVATNTWKRAALATW